MPPQSRADTPLTLPSLVHTPQVQAETSPSHFLFPLDVTVAAQWDSAPGYELAWPKLKLDLALGDGGIALSLRRAQATRRRHACTPCAARVRAGLSHR